MTDREEIFARVEILDEISVYYETKVTPLFEEDYLNEFLDFLRIRKNRNVELIDSPEGGFRETLREVSGYDRYEPIADKAEELFGLPRRVRVFRDDSALIDEMEGPRGWAYFFFVFGMMFCEYDGFTLCFMSGTNN